MTILTTPILAKPTDKYSDQLSIYVNLYQHAKNQAVALIYFRDMVG